LTTTITQKIVGYNVVKKDDAPAPVPTATLHEALARPDVLPGATYKVKTPLSDHALYITINDIILNPGTPMESRRPFEMFINCKAMDHFQWIVALTRIVSAVFRKGGEMTFLVDELRSVFDPKGGYFRKGGKFMPSLVAEIGDVLETHLADLGLIVRDNSLAEAAQAMVAAKIEKISAATPNKMLCGKCNEYAAVLMDGCLTCLNCGDSKCG
jgi:bacterioferritin-associated ferredoxin